MASETERPESSLGTVLNPNKTRGRWRTVEGLDHPIALRMEGALVEAKIPREEQTPDQMKEVNWAPLSEVRMAGIPNLKIQVERKARTQDAAEMEANEATSGQQVVWSIMVRR